MPTLKINNIEEFTKAYERAPQLRTQLQKAFPDYYKQYTNNLMDVLYPKETPSQTNKATIKSPSGNTRNIVDRVSKGVAPILKGIGRAILPVYQIGSTVSNWNAPGASPQSRTLDVVSSGASFFPGIGTGVAIGTSMLGALARDLNNNNISQDDLNKIDPRFINEDTLRRYGRQVSQEDFSSQINKLNQDINSLNPSYWDEAEARLNNLNYTPSQGNNIPLNLSPLETSRTPVNNQIGITNQNNIQPLLNPISVPSISIDSLNSIIDGNKGSLSGGLIRNANNLGLQNLSEITQGNNIMAPIPQTEQDNINQYAQLLGAMQRQSENTQAGLLNNYLEALRGKRQRQAINDFATNLGNQLVSAQPMITAGYVSSKGNYIEPGYVNVNYGDRFRQQSPRVDTTNSDIARLQMEYQQNLANNQLEYVKQLQNMEAARALGNQLGVNPGVFLNTDLGQQYLSSVTNPEVEGKERRLDIYPQTYADILKSRDEFGNEVDLANINNQAQLEKALINYNAILNQANISGQYNLRNQLISQMNQNYRAQLQANNESYLKQLGYQNAKDVANIYANAGINLAQFKAQNPDPTSNVRAFADILGNSRSPQEALLYYNMLMGNQQQAQQLPQQDNNGLTIEQAQTLFNLLR